MCIQGNSRFEGGWRSVTDIEVDKAGRKVEAYVVSLTAEGERFARRNSIIWFTIFILIRLDGRILTGPPGIKPQLHDGMTCSRQSQSCQCRVDPRFRSISSVLEVINRRRYVPGNPIFSGEFASTPNLTPILGVGTRNSTDVFLKVHPTSPVSTWSVFRSRSPLMAGLKSLDTIGNSKKMI